MFERSFKEYPVSFISFLHNNNNWILLFKRYFALSTFSFLETHHGTARAHKHSILSFLSSTLLYRTIAFILCVILIIDKAPTVYRKHPTLLSSSLLLIQGCSPYCHSHRDKTLTLTDRCCRPIVVADIHIYIYVRTIYKYFYIFMCI